MKKPIVIIPARGGSKRIPKKNIKLFDGLPIIGYPIKELKDSNRFESIYVSTDNPEIAQISESFGAIVPGLRPATLADDFTTTLEVISNEIIRFKLDQDPDRTICCVYPGTPMLKSQQVIQAVEILESENWDYVISAKKIESPIQRSFFLDSKKRIKLHFPKQENTRTQDLDTSYEDAGQFYCGKMRNWIFKVPIFSSKSTLFLIEEEGFYDIDTIENWFDAEDYFKLHKNISQD
jgi:N-acylneuraminate cytidylyltransferase